MTHNVTLQHNLLVLREFPNKKGTTGVRLWPVLIYKYPVIHSAVKTGRLGHTVEKKKNVKTESWPVDQIDNVTT